MKSVIIRLIIGFCIKNKNKRKSSERLLVASYDDVNRLQNIFSILFNNIIIYIINFIITIFKILFNHNLMLIF